MSQKYISKKNKTNFRRARISVIHEIANFIKQNCKLSKIRLKSRYLYLKCARERPQRFIRSTNITSDTRSSPETDL